MPLSLPSNAEKTIVIALPLAFYIIGSSPN